MKDDSEKKALNIYRVDGWVKVDFLNRTIGERGAQIRLNKITLQFPEAPDWVIKPAANHTFIRFQDQTRRTCNAAETIALDGLEFEAEQFWIDRGAKKERKPIAMNPAKATAAISKMTEADQAETLKILASDPKFSDMLRDMFTTN